MPDEKPDDNTDIQDDVKWLEERLDAQDTQQKKLEALLLSIQTKIETTTETMPQSLLTKIAAMEAEIISLKALKPSAVNPSNPPNSEVTKPSSMVSDEDEGENPAAKIKSPPNRRTFRKAI